MVEASNRAGPTSKPPADLPLPNSVQGSASTSRRRAGHRSRSTFFIGGAAEIEVVNVLSHQVIEEGCFILTEVVGGP